MILIKKLIKELYNILRITDLNTSLRYIQKLILNFPRVISTKSLVSVDKEMRNISCKFKIKGKNMIFSGQYFGGLREICCRQVYFTMPGFKIDENDVIVDLGANAGIFTTLAAMLGKKVIAVEAQSEFIPIIEHNLKINNCLEKAFIEFGIIGQNTGLLSKETERKDSSHWKKEPPILSMKEIIQRNNINEIDFLKIDIEGSEFNLLSGNIDWLYKVKKIAMEVHLEYGKVEALTSILKDKGFNIWIVDNNQNIRDTLTGKGGYLFGVRNG